MPRLAIAQIRPTKGEYAANVQRIGGVLAQLAKLEPAVDLVVFPETATSGYFVEGGVRDVAVTAGAPVPALPPRGPGRPAPPPARRRGGVGGPSAGGRGSGVCAWRPRAWWGWGGGGGPGGGGGG